ncbi:hypothetical protein ACFLR4_02520 [Bacteroidota bacterium]
MKNKQVIFLAGLAMILFYAGYLVNTPSIVSPPATKDLTIKKIDNVWKVVDGQNKTKIHVKGGDKITWLASGSDVTFNFPDAKYLKHETTGEDLPNGYTAPLKNGKKFKLKIKDNAKQDTIVYSVFVNIDSVYAVGSSPPKIIID